MASARDATNRAEIDTSLPFSSVKAAVSMFGEKSEAMKSKASSAIDPKALCQLLKWCCEKSHILVGREIHLYVLKNGLISDAYLKNYLIRMYSACGCLDEAHHVFSNLSEPDVFSWSAIISACTKHGQHETALRLYSRMKESRVEPDGHTYVAALTACINGLFLEEGKMIHSHIIASSLVADPYVNNTVIDMYAKCGSVDDARKAFSTSRNRELVTWNTLLAGLVQHKLWQQAIQHFQAMQHLDIEPNQVTFCCVLKACTNIGDSHQGMICNAYAVEHSLELDVYVSNSLIDIYAKTGRLQDAETMFAMMPKRDVVTWSAMIAGYAHCGFMKEALDEYEMMQGNGVEPNDVTFVSILTACTGLKDLDLGMLIHSFMMSKGALFTSVVTNALIDMYAKCGSFDDALRIFELACKDDVVTWNAVIGGCTLNGCSHMAVDMFKRMMQQGIDPNEPTFLNIISGCTSDICQGRMIHVQIIGCDYHKTTRVSNNLMHMYIKTMRITEACKIFGQMQKHDVVTWNTMIGGCNECGLAQKALDLFYQMQHHRVNANAATFVCVLKACSGTAALDIGRMIHAYILESNFVLDPCDDIGSMLINFYARCGNLEDAQSVLSILDDRSLGPWSALIAGCAQGNNYKEALVYFEDMQKQGILPDDVAYVSLLSCFSHSGMLLECELQLERMRNGDGIAPCLKHYNCMADLLGRAGYLKQAEAVLQSMPYEPDIASWISLCSHCRMHNDKELAGWCFSNSL